jgi:cysteine synthase
VPVIVSPSDTRTLGDLKSRIADELARADLEPQIALAITDAIEEASTHRFWFMETRGLTINLSAGVAYYAAADMADLIEIDRLVLVTSEQGLRHSD